MNPINIPVDVDSEWGSWLINTLNQGSGAPIMYGGLSIGGIQRRIKLTGVFGIDYNESGAVVRTQWEVVPSGD